MAFKRHRGYDESIGMKVIATGLPRFSNLAVDFLRAHGDPSDRFLALDPCTRNSKLRYLFELPTAQALMTFWGFLSDDDHRTFALKTALRMRKHVLQCWVGTDVIVAQGSAVVFAPFRDNCIHLCEAEWTRDELAELGVAARVLPRFPFSDGIPSDSEISTSGRFEILAYVGAGREDFYRLPDLIRLACEFPEVMMKACGTVPSDVLLPANLQAIGWVDDMRGLYRDCAVFIRIPQHDGFSYSVREALSWGCEVIASYPYEYCRHAPDYGSLRDHVQALKEGFENGGLRPNLAGREYVLREFDAERVFERLLPFLSGAHGGAN